MPGVRSVGNGRLPGCNEVEFELKRAVDYLVETRKGVARCPHDQEWLGMYREADAAVRKACAAYLAR